MIFYRKNIVKYITKNLKFLNLSKCFSLLSLHLLRISWLVVVCDRGSFSVWITRDGWSISVDGITVCSGCRSQMRFGRCNAHTPAGIAATDHYGFIGCYATPSILLIHCYEARTGMQIELFCGGAALSEWNSFYWKLVGFRDMDRELFA